MVACMMVLISSFWTSVLHYILTCCPLKAKHHLSSFKLHSTDWISLFSAQPPQHTQAPIAHKVQCKSRTVRLLLNLTMLKHSSLVRRILQRIPLYPPHLQASSICEPQA